MTRRSHHSISTTHYTARYQLADKDGLRRWLVCSTPLGTFDHLWLQLGPVARGITITTAYAVSLAVMLIGAIGVQDHPLAWSLPLLATCAACVAITGLLMRPGTLGSRNGNRIVAELVDNKALRGPDLERAARKADLADQLRRAMFGGWHGYTEVMDQARFAARVVGILGERTSEDCITALRHGDHDVPLLLWRQIAEDTRMAAMSADMLKIVVEGSLQQTSTPEDYEHMLRRSVGAVLYQMGLAWRTGCDKIPAATHRAGTDTFREITERWGKALTH